MKPDVSAPEILHPRSRKHRNGHLQPLARGLLCLGVVIGMVPGIAVAICIGQAVRIEPGRFVDAEPVRSALANDTERRP